MEFSLSNRYVRGTLCFLSQVEWTARETDSKVGRISLQWLKFRPVFHLTIEGMSESPEETLEKAIVLRLIWIEGITSFDTSRVTRNSRLQKVTMPDSF